jgi:hypothetical protein
MKKLVVAVLLIFAATTTVSAAFFSDDVYGFQKSPTVSQFGVNGSHVYACQKFTAPKTGNIRGGCILYYNYADSCDFDYGVKSTWDGSFQASREINARSDSNGYRSSCADFGSTYSVTAGNAYWVCVDGKDDCDSASAYTAVYEVGNSSAAEETDVYWPILPDHAPDENNYYRRNSWKDSSLVTEGYGLVQWLYYSSPSDKDDYYGWPYNSAGEEYITSVGDYATQEIKIVNGSSFDASKVSLRVKRHYPSSCAFTAKVSIIEGSDYLGYGTFTCSVVPSDDYYVWVDVQLNQTVTLENGTDYEIKVERITGGTGYAFDWVYRRWSASPSVDDKYSLGNKYTASSPYFGWPALFGWDNSDFLVYLSSGSANGESCSDDEECASGNCVESVCCDDPCDGTCESCLAANTPSADGTCDDIDSGSDPDGECSATNCYTGNCDGSGACDIYSGGEEGACSACQGCTDSDSACDNFADHTQDSTGSNTCTGNCQECNGAGACVNQDSGDDYFDDCSTTNCYSGDCDGSGSCEIYDSGEEGTCAVCYECNDADSSCDLIADHNQDDTGSNQCTDSCKECDGAGNCAFQDDGDDYFSDCTASGDCNEGNCDGAGSCDILESGQGDCGLCYTCSDSDIACDLVPDGSDTHNECTASGDCNEGNCDGAGACDIIESGEGDCAVCYTCNDADIACDLIADHNQDDEGSNTCTGTCQECNGAGSCTNQDDGSDYFSDCTPNSDCNEGNCDGAGACDILESGEGDCAVCYECSDADIACDLIADHNQDTVGSNQCDSPCVECDGAGSCTNQEQGDDYFSDCAAINCNTGVCDGSGSCEIYSGGEEGTCATCQGCTDSDAACDNLADHTQDDVGSNTCTSTCKECDGTGSCVNQEASQDYFNDCPAADCYTGDCDGDGACAFYYSGEEGACDACYGCTDGDSACDALADHTQDDVGSNTCTGTCKECNGAGVCANQDENQDYFNQCGIIQCDEDALTPYYWGWDTLICYYAQDVAAGDASCDGVGTCKTASDYCGTQPQNGATDVEAGCEDAQIDCSGTTIGSFDNLQCWATPSAENVSIIPTPAESATDLNCSYDFADPWGQDENFDDRFFMWFKDSALQDELNNTFNISNTYTSVGDDWMCSVRVANLNNISGFFNSTTVNIGDGTPPYNTTEFEISNDDPCSDESSTLSVHVFDASSGIDDVLIETTVPTTGLSNISMTCDVGNDVDCLMTLFGYSATVTVHRFFMIDGNSNVAERDLMNQTITFHTCETPSENNGGGGGRSGEEKKIKILPRTIIDGKQRPEKAYLVGSKLKTYTVMPLTGGTLELSLDIEADILDVNGEKVDPTAFFKTIPKDTITLKNKESMNLSVYCEIPSEYKFAPYGLFAAKLTVGGEEREQIEITCESEEHAAGAAAIANILHEEIKGLGITVWQFLVIIAIIIAFYTFATRTKSKNDSILG